MTPSTNGTAHGTTNGTTRGVSGGRAETRHVVVIGGGLAGLAAAAECSSLGFRVTIVEQNEHLGGKMNVLEDQGYRFDMGPTIITLPQVLRGIIERAGGRVEEYLDLIDLDPQWRCHFEDGTVIDLRRGLEPMAESLRGQFGAETAEGYRKFVEWSRRMFRLSEKVFFYRDLGGIGDMMAKPPKDRELLGDVAKMRLHATVGDTVHRFIPDPRVRQMCEHFLQYVGSSPFLSPAILGLIASAQTDNGCWYAMAPDGKDGGTRMVARSVRRICEEAGVRFVTGKRVLGILNDGIEATGVALDDGSMIEADVVVSNCDVQRTYRDLLGFENPRRPSAQTEAQRIAKAYEPACSGVVLYLGLDRQYEHLAHHNFLFSRDSAQEFEDIYTKGIPARDPTLYLAVPSRTDPTQAPEGGEALYILVHTAYKREHQRWDGPGGLLEEYRPVILEKLKRFGMEDVEQHIKVERNLTPDGIDKMYNAEGGAIYGLASHGRLAGGFKPKNRSRVLPNLYLAGGSANPGPGVPMVLMSGVTAARAVAEDLGVDPGPVPLAAERDNPYSAVAGAAPAAAGA